MRILYKKNVQFDRNQMKRAERVTTLYFLGIPIYKSELFFEVINYTK